jgi:hypothetical protein
MEHMSSLLMQSFLMQYLPLAKQINNSQPVSKQSARYEAVPRNLGCIESVNLYDLFSTLYSVPSGSSAAIAPVKSPLPASTGSETLCGYYFHEAVRPEWIRTFVTLICRGTYSAFE